MRIDLDPGTAVEYSAGASEVAGVRATSDLLLSGGELRVVGMLQVNAPFVVTGGELIDAFVLAPLTANQIMLSGSAVFDRVIIESDLTVANGSTLRVANTLTLDGSTVSMASTGLSTIVRFIAPNGGNGLYGNGELVFNSDTLLDSVSRVDNEAGIDVTIGPDITLRAGTSGGEVIIIRGVLNVEGTVVNELAGRLVRLRAITEPEAAVNLLGDLVATNGGLLSVVSDNSIAIDGTITATGGGDVEVLAEFGSVSISASSIISVTDARLDLVGAWVNEGLIEVTNGVFSTGLSNDVFWDNDGTINLVDTQTLLFGAFTPEDFGAFNTNGDVLFRGRYDNTGVDFDISEFSALTFPGNFVLDGGEIFGGTLVTTPVVVTEQKLGLNGVTLQTSLTVGNAGTVEIANGLTLDNQIITLTRENSIGGLRFISSTQANGLFGTGEVVSGIAGDTSAANSLSGESNVDVTLGPGINVRTNTQGLSISASRARLSVHGDLVNNLDGQTLSLLIFSFGSSLEFFGAAQALDGGSLTIRSWSGGSMQIDSDIVVAGGGDLEIRGSATIAAASSIEVSDGEFSLTGEWVNNGLIDVTDGAFFTGGSSLQQWHNNGEIRLVNTPTELRGRFTPADLADFTTDRDLNFSGLLDLLGASIDIGVDLPDGFRLRGGTLSNGRLFRTPISFFGDELRLTDVTMAIGLTVTNGAMVTVVNSLTLENSNVTLAATDDTSALHFDSSADDSGLFGNGELIFAGTSGDDAANQVTGASGVALTIGPNITVRTSTAGGEISSNRESLNIEGAVLSNQAGRTVRLYAQSVPSAVNISGSVQGVDGGNVDISSAFGDVFFAPPATLGVTGGRLDLSGEWVNEGRIDVIDGVFDTGDDVETSWTNNGLVVLTNSVTELGGLINLNGFGSFQTTDAVVLDGRIDITGQAIDLGAQIPGNFSLGGGDIVGGTLVGGPLTVTAGAPTLFGVTLATNLIIGNATEVDVRNSLTLDNGTVTLASSGSSTSLTFPQTSSANSVTGVGEIVFSGSTGSNTANRIFSGTNGSLTFGPDVTIRTDTVGGDISTIGGPLTVQGTLISDVVGARINLRTSGTNSANTLAGIARIGPGGLLRFGSEATFSPAARLLIEIGGVADTQFGAVEVTTQAVTLGGELELALVDGFVPALGDSFDVLSATTLNGVFDSEIGTDIGGGLALDVNYAISNVIIDTIAAP
ncbi:MAG: beta strand repeat-containing protein [Gammaproteobacteria bacterium]